MGLVGYNKRFLFAAVGAPGSTHDARMLKSTRMYYQILNGDVLPNRAMYISTVVEKYRLLQSVTVLFRDFHGY